MADNKLNDGAEAPAAQQPCPAPSSSFSPRRRMTLRGRIFCYLLAFTAVIIAVLWLCFGVFLNNFYETIKLSEIRSAAVFLSQRVGSDDFTAEANSLAHRSELSLLLIKLSGDSVFNPYTVLYSVEAGGSAIHNISENSIVGLCSAASDAGGTLLRRYRYDPRLGQYYVVGSTASPIRSDDSAGDYMISVTLTENEAGETVALLLNSVISPLDATVHTLRVLLGFISLLLLALSALISLLISRRLSRPLARMSRSAGNLARGDYAANFDGAGYRESEELAAALNYAAGELSRTDTLRRELIANISHDLRTPLTMISGYAEIMRDLPGESTPENAQIIIDEANRLTILVNDVLDISKLETGNQPLTLTRFDLADALGETVGRTAKMQAAQGYNISFENETGGAVFIRTDRTRFMQAVGNLLSNAVTYTGEDGGVAVRLSVADGRARVSVSDTGAGIPAEKLPLIWDRYYRASSPRHAGTPAGSGLGLSIVKSTMTLLGGSYGVTSTLGVGSTFYVALPLAADEDGDDGVNVR